jgi:hypothetical protein
MKKNVIDNPRYPHHIRIIRKVICDWLSDEDSEQELVVYEGAGRSYTDTTTTGDAKVDSNKRKCSIPVRFDKWQTEDEQGHILIPMSGDIVYVTKGSITEEWEVKDFEPDNNRTIVYGEHNRNLNIENGGSQ